MKTFKANEELKELLIRQGFENITSIRDKKKAKSTFKLEGKGKKEVYFNYINIQILDRHSEHDSRYTLTEMELKSLILFFRLNRADYRLIHPQNRFTFDLVQKRLKEIKDELRVLTEKDIRHRRRINLMRILRTFKNIKLDYNIALEAVQ